MKPVYLIAAVSEKGGIGVKNDLPWRLKKEMAHFTSLTSKTKDPRLVNAVLMGRKTWDSVPPKYKPFSNRTNVVISSQSLQVPDGVFVYKSVSEAVRVLQTDSFPAIESVWLIGGAGIYKEALDKHLCDKLYITRIKKYFDCDTFFPDFNEEDYNLVVENGIPTDEQEENGLRYEFKIYEKKTEL